MNDAVKNIKINFNYSYLLIARKTVLEDAYKEIKEKIFLDFGKIK
jgi:ribonuclease P protein component